MLNYQTMLQQKETRAEVAFEDYLDTQYPIVRIGQSTFLPSEILRACDPVGYNKTFWHWVEATHVPSQALLKEWN